MNGFEKHGLPVPKFEEIGNGFRTTAFKELIKKDRVNEKDRVKDRVNDRAKDRAKDRVNEKDTLKSKERETVLLQMVKENPSLSAVELSEMLNINERNTRKYLSKLKKEGKLKRIGSDKTGTWLVSEK